MVNDPLGFALGPGHSAFVVDFDLGRYPDVALDGAGERRANVLRSAIGTGSRVEFDVDCQGIEIASPCQLDLGMRAQGHLCQHLFLDL